MLGAKSFESTSELTLEKSSDSDPIIQMARIRFESEQPDLEKSLNKTFFSNL